MNKTAAKYIAIGLLSITFFSTVSSDVYATEKHNKVKIECQKGITSDFEYFEEDSVAGDLILTLADKLRELKRNGATDEELNAYTEKVFSRSRYDLTDYVSGLLNSKEKELFNSNKAKGTLCLANGKLAVDYAQKNYISNQLHNGNGDAFRHTLWCYGMVVDVGYDFAKKWSDAHENGAVGQPSIEKKMDLHNNAVGLNLGKTYPNTISHSKFISRTKSKVDAGSCRRIQSGKLTWTNVYGKK